jgi:hypothetical protein
VTLNVTDCEMGAGCSGHDKTPPDEGASEKGPSGSDRPEEEEGDSRPPTPFSRPITAVVLQRKITDFKTIY